MGRAERRLSDPIAYVSREQFILERCAGQRVLHLGFLGETNRPLNDRLAFIAGPDSLHSRLARASERVVGVDIASSAIELLREKGLKDVFSGDVERLDASNVTRSPPFSVIVAGDIIEHLSNPGRMLESIKVFLVQGGEVIFATPNAFGLPNFFRFVRGSFSEGADHVQSYSEFTLCNLLERHGWEVAQAYTCYQERAAELNGATVFRVGRFLLSQMPRFGGTLLLVARLRTHDPLRA